MTEDAWLTCDDWRPMLDHLAQKVTKRKGTLYICAGLRRLWDLLFDDDSRRAVEVAERAADGAASFEEMCRAHILAEAPTFGGYFEPESVRGHTRDPVHWPAVTRLLEMGIYSEVDTLGDQPLGDEETVRRLLNAACIAMENLDRYITEGIKDKVYGLHGRLVGHLASQPEWPGGWLVREVFGNPFRPVEVDPAWRTDAALFFAGRAYDGRCFDDLPLLADVLENAGCDADELLEHLHDPGPHVLGCWALDLVLGKPA
jgi:hypothetical protein